MAAFGGDCRERCDCRLYNCKICNPDKPRQSPQAASEAVSAELTGSDAGLLMGLWPDFLEWVAEYAGDETTADKAVYSLEDMRYAFLAGYQKAKQYSNV